jgi:TRAP transporter TAXI family solute receptor
MFPPSSNIKFRRIPNINWRAFSPLLGVCLLLLATLGGSQSALGQWNRSTDDFHDKLMNLGKGPEGSSFGKIGHTLCETLNEVREKFLIRCIAHHSAGSVFNIHAVANGSLQLGFGQEDLLAEAFVHLKAQSDNPLRVVALVDNTPISIMVRKASGITDLWQIQRGIVNKGKKGSGIHANVTALLKAMKLEDRDLAGVTFLLPNDAEEAFCAGKVDVFVNATPQPSDVNRRLRACGGEFLDIPPDIMEKMMAKNAWLQPMDIVPGIYDQLQQQVKTLGMRNLLITNSSVDEEAIFRVANIINDKYKDMQAKQPYTTSMTLIREKDALSLPAPLHPGVLRALKMLQP